MTKMTAGCLETSLMTVLLVLVSIVVGFLIGSYYTKQQHVKENFVDASTISFGVFLGLLCLFIIGFMIFIIFLDKK